MTYSHSRTVCHKMNYISIEYQLKKNWITSTQSSETISKNLKITLWCVGWIATSYTHYKYSSPAMTHLVPLGTWWVIHNLIFVDNRLIVVLDNVPPAHLWRDWVELTHIIQCQHDGATPASIIGFWFFDFEWLILTAIYWTSCYKVWFQLRLLCLHP